MPDVLIVGAGPTGLGAAYTFHDTGTDWELYERATDAGGLAGSTQVDGYTWDFGGHVGFSNFGEYNQLMDNLLGHDGWIWHERRAAALINGELIPYPVQHHEHLLPPATRETAQPVQHPPGDSFAQWMAGQFSERVLQHFMNPYNTKLWTVNPENLSSCWVANRVAANSRTANGNNWGPNQRFRYPTHGGTGAPWRALLQQLPASRIKLNVELTHLDADRHIAQFSDGTTKHYNSIISTIPLTTLLQRTTGLPTFNTNTIQNTSVALIGLGITGQPPPILENIDWLYCADNQLDCYRITVLSRYSPFNTPHGHWSLLAETAGSNRFAPPKPATLTESLRQLGLCNPTNIRTVWTQYLQHGYPIPLIGRDRTLQQVQTQLEQRNIFSRGRFGAWRYEVSNQDHSTMQGIEIAQRLLHGKHETTLWNTH